MSDYSTGSVRSEDGTVIGYRQLGRGPGCVLLHGALQASQNLMKLAAALTDTFTVYVPDRRGRGLSGPPGDGYTIEKDCQDVAAVLAKTGARNVFGLSSGAIIALEAARTIGDVRKVAAYEPPLYPGGRPGWMSRYDREIAAGGLASAFVTVVKGARASVAFALLPRFVLTPLVGLAVAGDAKKVTGHDVSLRELIPTMAFETHLIPDGGGLASFADLASDVLLLGGSRSPTYLRATLDQLGAILPGARRAEFPGLGHSGPDDRGAPHTVAGELRRFFSD